MALFSKSKKEEKRPEFSVLPNHLGIIMDGNGRWAKKRGLPRTAGHKQGGETFRAISNACAEIGIKYVTFYAFSTENWKRPKEEIDTLMGYFKDYLLEAKRDFVKAGNNRIIFIGDRSALNQELVDLMNEAEKETEDHTGTTVYLAINYGGRQEIVNSVNKLLKEGKTEITEEDISSGLYTVPECDMIIRPSGEQRLSNFLLWQAAYSEFWYSNVLWPDFSVEDLYSALRDYEKRNRRFGGQ